MGIIKFGGPLAAALALVAVLLPNATTARVLALMSEASTAAADQPLKPSADRYAKCSATQPNVPYHVLSFGNVSAAVASQACQRALDAAQRCFVTSDRRICPVESSTTLRESGKTIVRQGKILEIRVYTSGTALPPGAYAAEVLFGDRIGHHVVLGLTLQDRDVHYGRWREYPLRRPEEQWLVPIEAPQGILRCSSKAPRVPYYGYVPSDVATRACQAALKLRYECWVAKRSASCPKVDPRIGVDSREVLRRGRLLYLGFSVALQRRNAYEVGGLFADDRSKVSNLHFTFDGSQVHDVYWDATPID